LVPNPRVQRRQMNANKAISERLKENQHTALPLSRGGQYEQDRVGGAYFKSATDRAASRPTRLARGHPSFDILIHDRPLDLHGMNLVRITETSGIPLVGSLYFGIIDRGTSLLQVRPSCSCNLNCPFCSVDAGPFSRTRTTAYEVDLDYLLQAAREIARFKGPGVECHIDSPGEPMLYPQIVPLVKELKSIEEVSVVSMQSNGTLLGRTMIEDLEGAGLDRINLSLQALSPDLARQLAGLPWYDVERIKNAAKIIAASQIDLLLSPVYLPGYNDAEIPQLIAFAREVGAGKRWPPLGIQKFERFRLGRRPRGLKEQSWWTFFNRSIKAWEVEAGIRLALKPEDFGIQRRPKIPSVFEKGERAWVEVRAPGWIKDEMLAVGRDRVVSVLHSPVQQGRVRVKMVSCKHNIYLSVPA
jgi:uncharacterized Fe-S cluster-containing radical SAM superfamily enzyme